MGNGCGSRRYSVQPSCPPGSPACRMCHVPVPWAKHTYTHIHLKSPSSSPSPRPPMHHLFLSPFLPLSLSSTHPGPLLLVLPKLNVTHPRLQILRLERPLQERLHCLTLNALFVILQNFPASDADESFLLLLNLLFLSPRILKPSIRPSIRPNRIVHFSFAAHILFSPSNGLLHPSNILTPLRNRHPLAIADVQKLLQVRVSCWGRAGRKAKLHYL